MNLKVVRMHFRLKAAGEGNCMRNKSTERNKKFSEIRVNDYVILVGKVWVLSASYQ